MFPNLVELRETIRMAMEGFCLGYDIVLPIPPAEIDIFSMYRKALGRPEGKSNPIR